MIKLLKNVTDARIENRLTNEEFILRSEVSEERQHLGRTLGC